MMSYAPALSSSHKQAIAILRADDGRTDAQKLAEIIQQRDELLALVKELSGGLNDFHPLVSKAEELIARCA